MKKIFIVSFLLAAVWSGSEAREWKVTFENGARFYSIDTTKDGGYIVAGELAGNFISAKIDVKGSLVWMKRYTQSYKNDKRAVITIRSVRDGGYLIGGTTEAKGYRDCMCAEGWLARLDDAGEILWQRKIGNIHDNFINSLRATSDGGAVIAGATTVKRKDNTIDFDGWVFKLDRNGRIEWQKNYSTQRDVGSRTYHDDDILQTVEPTRDGGYIVAGRTYWPHAYVDTEGAWVLKLDADGNIQWQKKYQDLYEEADGKIRYNYSNVFSIQQLQDGGYIFAGEGVFDNDTDKSLWVVRLDAKGKILWQKRYGKYGNCAYVIHRTQDGGYRIAGHHNTAYSLTLKIDRKGKVLWQKDYSEYAVGGFFSSVPSRDGGFVLTGAGMVVKANRSGEIPGCSEVREINITGIVEESDAITETTHASAHDINRTVYSTKATTIELHPALKHYCNVDLRLQSPNGGILSAGLHKNLRWSADFAGDYQTLPSAFGLKYSLDRGRHWKKIVADLDNDIRRYRWRVPAQWHDYSKRVLVRVDAFDDLNRITGDLSDHPLTLRIVKVFAPNKKVTLKSGEKYTIRWHISAKGKIGRTILQMSTDNGKHWKWIKTITNTNLRSWKWTIPHTPSDRCRIRVIVKNAKGKTIGMDTSDRPFRIE